MTIEQKAREIAKGLSDMEREWLTGWQGPAGAAFNCVAGDLRHKGLLKGPCDWNLSPLGQQVRALIEEQKV